MAVGEGIAVGTGVGVAVGTAVGVTVGAGVAVGTGVEVTTEAGFKEGDGAIHPTHTTRSNNPQPTILIAAILHPWWPQGSRKHCVPHSATQCHVMRRCHPATQWAAGATKEQSVDLT